MAEPTPPAPANQPTSRNPKAEVKAAKAYAKATRPWYKKKRFILPIALVVIIVIIQSMSGGGGSEKVTASDTASDTPSKSDGDKVGSKSNPIKVGATVKLEGTQYTVKSAKTASSVGSEFFSEKANGIYVVVELTIENKKDETKTFLDDAAKFLTTNGKSYSTDSNGTVAVMGDNGDPLMLADMQPDVPKTGMLVYDVPKDKAVGGLLEVSDLFGGGEAYIDLGLK